MTANPLRDLPSVDALLRTGAGEALVGEHGRQAVVAALRGGACGGACGGGGSRSGRPAGDGGAAAGTAAQPASGAERDRRDHPHQPGPRAAGGGCDRAGGRGGGGLLDARVRPGGGASRLAARPPLRSAVEPDGRGGGAGREQQRGGRAAVPRGDGGRRRGADQPRSADRDRRRVPDPRHPRPVGRAAGGGRHHEPHQHRGLSQGDHERDAGDPAGAPVELPDRRVHGPPRAGRSWRSWRAETWR